MYADGQAATQRAPKGAWSGLLPSMSSMLDYMLLSAISIPQELARQIPANHTHSHARTHMHTYTARDIDG